MSGGPVPRAVTRGHAQEIAARELGLGVATWRALGTSAQLLVTEPGALEASRAAVETVLADVDLAASRFRADSELSRVNASDGGWEAITPLFVRLLRVALDAAEWTDGMVDPTVGASLIDLGYDRTFRQLPSDGPAVIVVVRPAPGWQRVELDDEAGRVRKPEGVLIDLGATAKGLASDLAAESVAAITGGGVLVNLGGDMRAIGSPTGGWDVLVTDDSDPERSSAPGEGQIISLREGGLATSSSTARRWRRGGSVLHHLIDPRSGLPSVGRWRTVSVAAETCLLANTASTAAVILGDRAPGWLTAHGFAARLVGDTAAITTLAGWPSDSPKESS